MSDTAPPPADDGSAAHEPEPTEEETAAAVSTGSMSGQAIAPDDDKIDLVPEGPNAPPHGEQAHP